MARIVILSADGATKLKTVSTLAELRETFPKICWPRDLNVITDELLLDIEENLRRRYGKIARVSNEVKAPAIAEFGERLVSDDVKQADGSWKQVWSVESAVALSAAKQQFAERIITSAWEALFERPTAAQVQQASFNLIDVLQMESSALSGPMKTARDAIIALDQSSSVQDVYRIWKEFNNAL